VVPFVEVRVALRLRATFVVFVIEFEGEGVGRFGEGGFSGVGGRLFSSESRSVNVESMEEFDMGMLQTNVDKSQSQEGGGEVVSRDEYEILIASVHGKGLCIYYWLFRNARFNQSR
jgi:hypothetical protein